MKIIQAFLRKSIMLSPLRTIYKTTATKNNLACLTLNNRHYVNFVSKRKISCISYLYPINLILSFKKKLRGSLQSRL